MPILPFLKKIIPLRFFMALQLPYHFLLAFSAALWFWFPSRKLFVIGITGTKGKTTVVELIHEILQAGGEKTASVSSLRFRVGGDTEINEKKINNTGKIFPTAVFASRCEIRMPLCCAGSHLRGN